MAVEGKQPLIAWDPRGTKITRNTIYESQGNITLTIPVEFAALVMGMLGASPVEKKLVDGSRIRTSALYDELQRQLGREFPEVHPIRKFGKDIIRQGQERPSYMRNE